MNDYLEERVLKTAKLISSTRCTVRDAAKVIGVSKSTIHYDMVNRLPNLSIKLYKEVREVMEYNKYNRSINITAQTKSNL